MAACAKYIDPIRYAWEFFHRAPFPRCLEGWHGRLVIGNQLVSHRKRRRA